MIGTIVVLAIVVVVSVGWTVLCIMGHRREQRELDEPFKRHMHVGNLGETNDR